MLNLRIIRKIISVCALTFLTGASAIAQVNTVTFGKNRVQYKKFDWRYYQTNNFNTYFSQGGLNLGKIVAQVAEEELAQLEDFVEYGLQRRANIVIYNSFDDMKQSNIGMDIDWQNTGGVTKLVNNKMVVYYNGNHAHLRRQVREGLARVLVDNLLFGDDLGEFAGNQALLDLPKWLTDGYIAYAAEAWNTELDDKLKSALLSGRYRNFYQFAFREPELAGHAFWRFIANNYRRDNVTYFLYLSRIYKSLNSASLKVTKKKFKDLLKEFMEVEGDKFNSDIRGRRNQPRGSVVAVEEVKPGLDYYRFQANPIERNRTYAMVKFRRGIYRIELEDLSDKRKILLKAGVLSNQNEINPHYPLMAWDPKGSKLLVVYSAEGKIRMFVYDMQARIKTYKQDLPEEFQLIQDARYMLDNNTLVLSAVKNGQSDIFVYKIREQTVQQITNDPYDDLDANFVAFPNKTGIIFSSNRPTSDAPKGDTVLPARHPFNIYLVDNWNQSEFRQITQLSKLKYGQARLPTQYNGNHFTFVSDENGIGNRWAGFFSTRRAGLDTIIKVGEEYLRNPSRAELDSTLKAWERNEPDSVGFFSITDDSTYVFPITNYQSSLRESRSAGDNNVVSEVRQEGDLKLLYKLRINEDVLKRRNINPRPTDFIRRLMNDERARRNDPTVYQKPEQRRDSVKTANIFQSEFDTQSDSSVIVVGSNEPKVKESLLKSARMYDYRMRFSSDYVVSGFNNSVLVNRFQPYGGGAGPINLSNTDAINGIIRMGISDLFEDVKFLGGFRIASNLRDNDYFASYQNLKKRIDWGVTYFRQIQNDFQIFDPVTDPRAYFPNKMFSNLYQFNISYPFDEVRSLRAQIGYRTDRVVVRPIYDPPIAVIAAQILKAPDSLLRYSLARLEYVHDNTINPTLNIWNGLRYKVYVDIASRLVKGNVQGRNTFNIGGDIRYYYPIYRNLIWAGRGSFDMSWGNQKLIYYVGGVDGWIAPKFNGSNQPDPDNTYAFQSLALNLRGHQQNAANGNNAVVMNSEIRLPIFTTLFSRPVNNAFLRNFQLVQFVDLATAWNGQFDKIGRPSNFYGTPPVQILVKPGGIGPFLGGYGFGARSTLLGYFLRVDAGWPMGGFFDRKPYWYFAMGLDF
jgi:hypothetical protein